MTDLERRALLGDQEAQEECTRQGIALPCPFCGGAAIVEYDTMEPFEYTVLCEDCGVMHGSSEDKQVTIAEWNRRPALPIGRCKDCAHSSPRMVMGNKTYGKVCKIDPYLVHEVNPDGYCDGFKPKEAPHD